MDAALKELEERKRLLELRRDDISKEIKRIENLIFQHMAAKRANISTEKINLKTRSKIFSRAVIVEYIRNYGSLTSRQIFDLQKRYDEDEKDYVGMNYNTLRSHLLRMKVDGYIKQDEKKRWVLISSADIMENTSIDPEN